MSTHVRSNEPRAPQHCESTATAPRKARACNAKASFSGCCGRVLLPPRSSKALICYGIHADCRAGSLVPSALHLVSRTKARSDNGGRRDRNGTTETVKAPAERSGLPSRNSRHATPAVRKLVNTQFTWRWPLLPPYRRPFPATFRPHTGQRPDSNPSARRNHESELRPARHECFPMHARPCEGGVQDLSERCSPIRVLAFASQQWRPTKTIDSNSQSCEPDSVEGVTA